MLIIIDKKIPSQAKFKLKTLGEIIELETSGITYEAISGHPDIFFCQSDNNLNVAPNLPKDYLNILLKHDISFVKGEKNVGSKYPFTSHYNAVITGKHLIHHAKYTDKTIADICNKKSFINIKQAYTRCNLISLNDDSFITSDKGIYSKLNSLGLNVLYASPFEIDLPTFNHGFFGGTCGIYRDTVYIIGSLKYHNQCEIIKMFIYDAGFKIEELYDGKLFDGGSILFID
jgi:hypothetical protein